MRLLLIEDHAPLRDAIGQYLTEAGYLVDTASTGDEGLWAADESGHDLILLDLMLPNIDGMEILRRLRAKRNPVHINVLSARDGLEDRLEALDAGADDYLVKPFPLAELLARVRSLLRRSYAKKSPLMQVADLELDPLRRTVRRKAQTIELTALEYRLLEYLIYRSGELVSRTAIWEHVFEWQEGLGTNRVVRDDGLFQFWNEANGETTRSARLKGRDLPKFHGATGDSLIKDVQLPGSRGTLRPIDELTVQMRDRAGHQLDSALELPSALPVELTGLAENFDSVLARVATTRQRERDFIRHAAHELRTPIAGLRAPPGGEIRIHGSITDGKMEIRIANQTDDLPDNLDRLFEPLFRKEFSRSDAGIHLGIGLTLSLEAAAAMGATLYARKAQGGWIEFVMTMPLLISEPKATNLLP